MQFIIVHMYSNNNLIYTSGDSTDFNNPNLKLAKTIKNKSLFIFTTKIMSYPCIIKFVFNAQTFATEYGVYSNCIVAKVSKENR